MVALATGSKAQLPAQHLPPQRLLALPDEPRLTGTTAAMVSHV